MSIVLLLSGGGGYVRILAQLLSAPKHAQRTMTQQRTFSLPEE